MDLLSNWWQDQLGKVSQPIEAIFKLKDLCGP